MRRRSDAIAAALAIAYAIASGCAAEDDRMDAVFPGPSASVGDDAQDDDAGDDDDGEATEESGGTAGADDGGPVGSDGASPPSDDAGMQTDDAGMPADDGAASGDDGMPPADDGGGGDPAQTCLDQAVTECEICACNSCLMQLQACQQDPGCIAIRTCAQQNMCTGIGCLEPCGDVIDMYGGPFGPSATLAKSLSDCVEPSCPTC